MTNFDKMNEIVKIGQSNLLRNEEFIRRWRLEIAETGETFSIDTRIFGVDLVLICIRGRLTEWKAMSCTGLAGNHSPYVVLD